MYTYMCAHTTHMAQPCVLLLYGKLRVQLATLQQLTTLVANQPGLIHTIIIGSASFKTVRLASKQSDSFKTSRVGNQSSAYTYV